jgi:type I restriction enzyme S subunit
VGSGKTPSGGATNYKSSGIIFLRSQNIYDEGLRLEDVSYIDEETDREMAYSRVIPDDVLLNITGASIGRTCIVPKNFPPANVNQHVCIFRLPKKSIIESKFLSYALKALKHYYAYTQKGAAREGLNFEQLRQMRIPVPPAIEQQQICQQIEKQLRKIDLLSERTEKSIKLLEEHRSALITAAVTGKIDVRKSK